VERVVDLRSDTLTVPTPEMRRAMFEAEVGDDCHREDPTVNKLQEIAAEVVGKEAALYVPTGTMGNCASIMALADRGGKFLSETFAHVSRYEDEGIRVCGRVDKITIDEPSGVLDPDHVREAIRAAKANGEDVRVLALENTANVRGGVVTPPDRMRELCDVAHEEGLKVHLDGARVFNAAVSLGCDGKELVRHVDNVMCCLSKGLGAPVGSMVAGTAETIKLVHRNRKMLGGGMRQAGVIAAAGIIALTKMVDRLAEDHENARILAEALAEIDGIEVDPSKVQTNIFMIRLGSEARAEELVRRAESRGVKFFHFWDGIIRLVTYNGITRDDVLYAARVIEECMKEIN